MLSAKNINFVFRFLMSLDWASPERSSQLQLKQDIVHQIGLLFTGSGDEDVVKRKRKKAMEQAVLDKHF
jgi:hypothetical protein